MPRLLVVEDDADVSDALAAVLEAMGHAVQIAPNGDRALTMLAGVEVVLVDIEMPVLDGPGMVVRMVLEDCGKEMIPVILVSGMGDVAAVAARLGTPYHLLKPFALDDLVEILDRALSERIPPAPLGAEHVR